MLRGISSFVRLNYYLVNDFCMFCLEKKYSAPFSKSSLITFTLPVKKLFFGYNHV